MWSKTCLFLNKDSKYEDFDYGLKQFEADLDEVLSLFNDGLNVEDFSINEYLYKPIKAYYNGDKGVTTLVFNSFLVKGGDKVIVRASKSNNKAVSSGITIAMFKKLFPKESIIEQYPEKDTLANDKIGEARIEGLVIAKLISEGIFKNIKDYNKWLIDFIANNVIISGKKAEKEVVVKKEVVNETPKKRGRKPKSTTKQDVQSLIGEGLDDIDIDNLAGIIEAFSKYNPED